MADNEDRALIAGWFSYSGAHATAGDLLAADVVSDWLQSAGIEYVLAVAPPLTGGVSIDDLDPDDFTHAFFVCGPWQRTSLEADFVRRFACCRLIGLNLSLDDPPGDWRPFDLLLERDSIGAVNPDLVFASRNPRPPMIGLCLVEPHPEADVEAANLAMAGLISRHDLACVPIDTRLDANEAGLRTKGEVEAVIGRMDALLTTRLHGLVLALKNGVPVVALDPVRGRGKISRQCRCIGWPNVLGLEELSDDHLDEALRFALSSEAKASAQACVAEAARGIETVRSQLLQGLRADGPLEEAYADRQTAAGMKRMAEALPAGRRRNSVGRSLSRFRKLIRSAR